MVLRRISPLFAVAALGGCHWVFPYGPARDATVEARRDAPSDVRPRLEAGIAEASALDAKHDAPRPGLDKSPPPDKKPFPDKSQPAPDKKPPVPDKSQPTADLPSKVDGSSICSVWANWTCLDGTTACNATCGTKRALSCAAGECSCTTMGPSVQCPYVPPTFVDCETACKPAFLSGCCKP